MRRSDLKNWVDGIEGQVKKILGYQGKHPLFVHAQDNCSETTRLLAHHMLLRSPKLEAWVLKGKAFGKWHEVLLVKREEKYLVFDPTIWQFFPRKRIAFLGTALDKNHAIRLIAEMFTGSWKVREPARVLSLATHKRFREIIFKNLQENLRERALTE